MNNNFANLLLPHFDIRFNYEENNRDQKTIILVTHLMKLVLMTKKYPELLDIIDWILLNDKNEINKKNSSNQTALIVACIT